MNHPAEEGIPKAAALASSRDVPTDFFSFGTMRSGFRRLSPARSRAARVLVVAVLVELMGGFFALAVGAERDYVLDLKPDTIGPAISKYEVIMLEFYAPWCGHCKRLAPEYERASRILYEMGSHAKLARIDADTYYKQVVSKYHVSGYPTLRLYTNGIPTDTEYDGRRTAEAIISYVMRYVVPPVKNLTTESDLASFVKNASDNSALFVGFGLDSSVLEEIAKKHRTKAFFAVMKDFPEKAMVDFDFDKEPALVSLHPKLEELSVFYGPFEDSDVQDFVLQHLLPMVSSIDSTDSVKRLTEDGRPIAIGIVGSMSDPASRSFVQKLRAAAPANRAFVFAYVEIITFLSFTQSFGVDKAALLPTVVIWDGKNHFSKPDHEDTFLGLRSETRLSEFLQDFRDEKLKVLELVEPSLLTLVRKTMFGLPALLIVAIFILIVLAIRSCCNDDLSEGDYEDDYKERGRRADIEGDVTAERTLTDTLDPLHLGKKSQKRD